MPEPIPIIGGTGALGWGLALRLTTQASRWRSDRAAPSGPPRRWSGWGHAAPDAEVEGLVNEEAARRGPIVFLTVPFRAQSENLTNLREALEPGQILVDCTVPTAAAVSGKATRSLGVWQGSAAQQAQEMVPDGVAVVAALHTVSAPTLCDPAAGSTRTCCSAVIAGPTRRGWRRIVELVPGLRAVNAGALRDGADRGAADAAPDLDQRAL